MSPEGVVWPEKPRILFVSGDPDDVPFVEHRDALLAAIGDFRYPGADDETVSAGGARVQVGSLLTVLCNPTLAEVLAECRKAAYTHVHLLTHGDQYESSVDSFGLVLRGPDGGPDVVSGERFASALTSVGDARIHRPSVVTIASCDSANVGTVAIPGASFAHALHQSGIPLVVASQFPLSKEGSVPLAGALYQGLLWGEHPLVLLQRLRAELHARYTSVWHDWASLVVYEALPQALADQLDTLKYLQARRAIDAGLQRFDLAVRGRDGNSLAGLDEAIDRAVERLPLGGRYGVECIGLRASSMKRRAQYAFTVASRQGRDLQSRRDPLDLLEQAALDYDSAARGLLVNEGKAVQRVATLHWVLVQVVSLAAVLGKDHDDERWIVARFCADLYGRHRDPEQVAWAHGSLAELWLLRHCRPDATAEDRARFAEAALLHIDELVRACASRTAFPLLSTLAQLRRYVDWWGSARFVGDLAKRDAHRRVSWDDCGLVETAQRLIERLERRVGTGGAAGGAPPDCRRPAGPRPRAPGSTEPAGGGSVPVPGTTGSAQSGVATPQTRRGPGSASPHRVARQDAAQVRPVLRHRDASGRPWRRAVDRVRRRGHDAPLAGRLRNPADGEAPAAAHRSGTRRRADARAVRDDAHRCRPHRRRAAVLQGAEARARLRRRVVQRLASPVRPAGRAAGRDVLVGDRGTRAAVERVARRRDHRRRRTNSRRRPCPGA